jgi:plastocyanin
MSDVRNRGRWALLAGLAMAASFGWLAPAPAAEGTRVLMVDNEPDLTAWHFDPAELTVPAGSTVVWFNKGKEEHTVTADNNSFDSGYKKTGTSWQRAFPRVGKYAYHCAPHPWMKGTVVVVAAAAAAADPAATRTAAGVETTAPPATTAPAPAATTTTFPPSLAAPSPAPDTAASAPEATTPPTQAESKQTSAAPAAARKGSGNNLAGTLAIVLLPTLGGLALGARLRRTKSPGG